MLALRSRAQRNFIATLLLSQGVPMLLHGDELGRTQDGNNNTYAQDSEISWVHWDEADRPLVEFTAAVARLRHQHPTFRRKRFFTGTTVRAGDGAEGDRLNDIVWLHPDGRPMDGDDWTAEGARVIGMYLNGHGIAGTDAVGNPITDDALPAVLQRRRRRRRADPASGGVRRRLGRADRHRGCHRPTPSRARPVAR